MVPLGPRIEERAHIICTKSKDGMLGSQRDAVQEMVWPTEEEEEEEAGLNVCLRVGTLCLTTLHDYSGPMRMHYEFHNELTHWTPADPQSVSRLHVLPPAWLSDSVISAPKRWCNPPLVDWREKLTNRTPFTSYGVTTYKWGLNWLDL